MSRRAQKSAARAQRTRPSRAPASAARPRRRRPAAPRPGRRRLGAAAADDRPADRRPLGARARALRPRLPLLPLRGVQARCDTPRRRRWASAASSAAAQLPPARVSLLRPLTPGDGPVAGAAGESLVHGRVRRRGRRPARRHPGVRRRSRATTRRRRCSPSRPCAWPSTTCPPTAGQVTTAAAMGDALIERLQQGRHRLRGAQPRTTCSSGSPRSGTAPPRRHEPSAVGRGVRTRRRRPFARRPSPTQSYGEFTPSSSATTGSCAVLSFSSAGGAAGGAGGAAEMRPVRRRISRCAGRGVGLPLFAGRLGPGRSGRRRRRLAFGRELLGRPMPTPARRDCSDPTAAAAPGRDWASRGDTSPAGQPRCVEAGSSPHGGGSYAAAAGRPAAEAASRYSPSAPAPPDARRGFVP